MRFIQEFINLIINHPFLIGIIAIFSNIIGIFIGNRLNVKRDRRKEYNVIAEEISLNLLKEKESIAKHNTANNIIEDVDFNKLAIRLTWFKLRRFNTLLEDYRKAKKTNYRNNKFGGCFYHDKDSVLNSINKLLKFTKLK